MLRSTEISKTSTFIGQTGIFSTSSAVCLGNIIRKIENDNKISNELKDNFIDAYNNIPNKTRIQLHNKYYREFVMEPVEQYYIEKMFWLMMKNLL